MAKTTVRSVQDQENGHHLALRTPMAVLLQATTLAHRARQSPWEFGVDGPLLIAAGLTQEQFQWLADEKYVQLTEQVTRQSNGATACRQMVLAQLHGKKRVVLTAAGEKAARSLCRVVVQQAALLPGRNGDCRARLVPTWDKANHRLSLAGFLIKVFKRPAPNQQLILAAFQELGWPRSIDDPLAPRPRTNPKHRLHDTIEDLKQHQITPLINFFGDGTGRGVGWEPRHDVLPMLQLT
jgi:hypothetical protein